MQSAAAMTAGLFDLGFAVFHACFWRLFGWPARLEASGSRNAAITQTLNAVLIYVFTIYGSAMIGFALTGGPAPRLLALAGAGFWTVRALAQAVLFKFWSQPLAVLTGIFVAAAVMHALAAAGPIGRPLPLY